MIGRVLTVLVVALALVAVPRVVAAALVLDTPVDGPVVAGFHLTDPYGPGHRGVDLAVPRGTAVLAPAPGTVTFAGPVAGAAWVTIDHGGVRSTVGPLTSVRVAVGASVRRGAVVGTSAAAHGRAAVHWSVRRGSTYLDPLRLTRPLVATLLPDRTTARTRPLTRQPPSWRARVR